MKALPAAVLAVTLGVTLQAQSDSEIEGLRTNDFARMFPQSVGGLERHKIDTFPDKQELRAEYADKDNTRKALVMIYTVDPNSQQAAKENDPYLDVVIASAEEAMKKDGAKPERHALTSKGGANVRCIDAIQSGDVLHSLCAAAVKGRIVEVQPLSRVDKDNPHQALEDNHALANDIVDGIAEAK